MDNHARLADHPWRPITGSGTLGLVLFFALGLDAATASSAGFAVEALRSLSTQQQPLTALATSDNGRLVASGTTSGEIAVWDVKTMKPICDWTSAMGAVRAVEFSPTGPLVASITVPDRVTVYDARNQEELWNAELTGTPSGLCFSPDGSRLAVSNPKDAVRIFEARTGDLTAIAQQEHAGSGGVTFSAGGRRVIVGETAGRSGDTDSAISCFDAQTGVLVRQLISLSSPSEVLRTSPSGGSVAALNHGGQLTLIDLEYAQPIARWETGIEAANEVRFLTETVLIASGPNQLAVAQLGTEEVTPIPSGRVGEHRAVAVIPHLRVLATAVDREIQFWRFSKAKAEAKAEAPAEPARDEPEKPDRMAEKPNRTFAPTDNQPPNNTVFDGLVETDQMQSMLSKPVHLLLKSGVRLDECTLTDLRFGRQGGGIRFVEYHTSSNRKVTVKASDLFSFVVGGRTYSFRYHHPSQQRFLIDRDVMLEMAKSRVGERGQKLLEPSTEAERAARVNEQRAFLEDAAKEVARFGTFHIEEGEQTLLFTDFPPGALAPLTRYSDQVCLELNRVFGVPLDRRIWDGKAIIAAFSNGEALEEYEEQVLNNPNHRGTGAVHRTSHGFIMTSVVKRLNRQTAFGTIWGLAMGYSNRVQSTVKLPSWVHTGLSNWIAYKIAPARDQSARRRAGVIKKLAANPTLGGLLHATRPGMETRPTSEQLIGFMISRSEAAFGQFLADLKHGHSLEDALMQSYGITPAQLASAFGRSLGIPNLTD